MIRFIFLLQLILIGTNVSAMSLYNKVLPTWQNTRLTSVLIDPNLGDKFKSLCLQGSAIPSHIDASIATMISNPVGKAIIANIVAALEPKKEYIEIIANIVQQMNTYIIATHYEDAIKLAMQLLDFVHTKTTATSTPFNPLNVTMAGIALGNMGATLLEGLKNYATPIVLPAYTALSVPTGLSENSEMLATTLRNQINDAIAILNDELNTLRFQFKDDDDYYNHETRTIAITDANVKASVISGPKLVTCATTVGYLTQYEDVLPDEKFCHEVLHYSHITLNKELLGDIKTIGTPFVAICHFDPSYTGVLGNIWSNHEELRTITGLFEVGGTLYFDPRNESSYLAAKGKKLRCSHVLNYCTKVPAYFYSYVSECLLNNTEKDAKAAIATNFKLFNDYTVSYIKQIDDLI
jgi:hypothetical protein